VLPISLAGGLLSAITAIGVAAIGIAAFGHYVNEIPGHFDVRPLELLALTLVSLLTSLAAAVFPARGAARTDVVAALAGRRGTVRTRKRVPLLGVIIAGAALTEIGLIICTPALLGLVSRAGRWVPLSARLALRDAGRNRSSAAPAVAAVMAAVIGSVALAIGVASSADQDRRAYQPRLPINDAFVWVDPSAKTEPQIVDAVRTALPGAKVVPVSTPPSYCQKAPCSKVVVAPGVQSQYGFLGSGDIPPVVIDDGSTAETLLQTTSAEAVAALHAGKVVVTDPSVIHQGRTTLTLYNVTAADSTQDGSSGTTQDGEKVSVPAVAVPKADAFVKLVIPPSLATRLEVKGEAGGVYARTSHRPTEHELQAANGALARIDQGSQLEVETGYHNPYQWMLLALLLASAVITLGAALIATALSNVDNRSDLTTLGAVGAAPRTRRLLSMSRAGVIAGIGTLLGVVAGFLPSFAWVHSQRSFDLTSLSSIDGGSSARMHFVIPGCRCW
jgi:putative ABC transport system permease protein